MCACSSAICLYLFVVLQTFVSASMYHACPTVASPMSAQCLHISTTHLTATVTKHSKFDFHLYFKKKKKRPGDFLLSNLASLDKILHFLLPSPNKKKKKIQIYCPTSASCKSSIWKHHVFHHHNQHQHI